MYKYIAEYRTDTRHAPMYEFCNRSTILHTKRTKMDKSNIYVSGDMQNQAFYKAMGCVEAEEYNQELVDKEPCDCLLECVL